MTHRSSWKTLLATALTLGFAAPSFAASPALSNVRPTGGQRGTELELSFNGQRLHDAEEILMEGPGIEILSLEAGKDGKDNVAKAKVKIAPDCRLGEHGFRVRTKSGVSELKTFQVGPFAVLEEKEPNTEFDKPQPIAREMVDAGVTIAGSMTGEDVDFYAIECKKGERLSVEVVGLRMGASMFDPYAAIVDADRFDVAKSDDNPFAKQDPVLSVRIPEDGVYTLEIRDSAYAGGGQYRAHVGRFPRPTVAYPAGGKRGEAVQVKFLGDAFGDLVQNVSIPSDSPVEHRAFAQDGQGTAPSGNLLRASDVGNALEVEPNNDPAAATPAGERLALNGVIDQPGDVDHFKVPLKKGQNLEIQCFARKIHSPLDPVLSILNLKGNQVAANDDAGGSQDSKLTFSAPADGEYLVKIADHLGRGGPTFVYRVEFSDPTPSIRLTIPQFARYSQERNAVAVPKGNRFATIMTADKLNYNGDVVVGAEGLPKGVKIVAPAMAKTMNVVPVLFEAEADAPLGAAFTTMSIHDPDNKVKGRYYQDCDLVQGPNQQTFWTYTSAKLNVAVTEEAPFRLELVQPKAPLVQNGSMQMKVVATRKEGFKGPIQVQFPFRPNGVNAGTNATIPEGQNEVLYPVNAAANAEVRKWQVFVIGSADVKGNLWAASGFVDLEVAAPFVSLRWNRDAVVQGEEAELIAKVTVNTPFEGTAQCKLVGLPDKLSTPELTLKPDTQELVFKIPTSAESPVGKHANLFCQLTIVHQGEPVVHNLGSTQLQVDKAPNKPAPKPEAAKTEAKPAAPPAEKAASRLEKLRLEKLKQEAEKNAASEKK